MGLEMWETPLGPITPVVQLEGQMTTDHQIGVRIPTGVL